VSDEVDFIVNPVAGGSSGRVVLTRVLDRLAGGPWNIRVHETRSAGHAVDLCRRIPGHHRAVVVCGGDGTIGEVAAGLVGSELPLAVLPTGTENIVAKAFGYRRAPGFVADLLERGILRTVDLGSANGKIFLIINGVGFDAQVAHRVAARRRGHIRRATYFLPALRALLTYRFPPLRVLVDGREAFAGRGIAFVGNLRRYATGLQILARARCDDGLLDVCVYPCSGPVGLLRHALNTMLRRHLRSGGVIYRQCRNVLITADVPIPVETDGDPAGTLPLEVGILPHKLRLLIPAGAPPA
jgi:YegS/Rv2252/BmrU family lipid kinase